MKLLLLICVLLPRALVAFSPSFRHQRSAFVTFRAEAKDDSSPETAPEVKEPKVVVSESKASEPKKEEKSETTSADKKEPETKEPEAIATEAKETEKKPEASEPEKAAAEEPTSEKEESKDFVPDEDDENNQPKGIFEGGGGASSFDVSKAIGGALQNEEGKELLFEFLGTAGSIAVDVLKGLRWAAANVFTASLPQDERLDMIAKLEPSLLVFGDREDGISVTTQGSSVGENIAAAAAAESRRLETWEKEKEKIIAKAEKAASERVASELKIQKQRIEQEQQEMRAKIEKERKEAEQAMEAEMKDRANDQAKVEKDGEELAALEKSLLEKDNQATKDKAELDKLAEELKAIKDAQKAKEEELQSIKKAQEQQLAELKAIKEAAPAPADDGSLFTAPPTLGGVQLRRYTPKEYDELSDDDKNNLRTLREQNPDWMESHPVLGPVVADLGYKRLHFVSAGNLGTIPIWEKQRIYRNDRAKSMAKDKMKAMNLGLPGVICLHEDSDGQLCIIDGQHRIGMMAELQETMKKKEDSGAMDFERVLVEVYEQVPDLKNHQQELFLEINKAEPVKLLDMPGVAKANVRDVITSGVNKLEDAYPNMFSPSQKCRAPNVNIDNLRNSLFAAEVMKRHKLTTANKLVRWLLEQNEALGKKYTEEIREAKDDPSYMEPTGWKKASDNEFYLGLDSTWLYK